MGTPLSPTITAPSFRYGIPEIISPEPHSVLPQEGQTGLTFLEISQADTFCFCSGVKGNFYHKG